MGSKLYGLYTQYVTSGERVVYFDLIPTQAPNFKARYHVVPTQGVQCPLLRLLIPLYA